MTGRKLSVVSFNVSDEYERGLYEFAIAQQKFLSRYIKRLIEQDRARKQEPVGEVMTIVPEDTPHAPNGIIDEDMRALALSCL